MATDPRQRPNPRRFLPDIGFDVPVWLQTLLTEMKYQLETLIQTPELAAPPTNLVAAPYNLMMVLYWTPSRKALKYRVYQNGVPNFSTALVRGEVTVPRFIDTRESSLLTTALTSNGETFYWVTAFNSAGVESSPLFRSVVIPFSNIDNSGTGADLNIRAEDPGTSIVFTTGQVDRVTITSAGSVVLAASEIAPGSFERYTNLPTMNGTPVGSPREFVGTAPVVFDRHSNSLYWFDHDEDEWYWVGRTLHRFRASNVQRSSDTLLTSTGLNVEVVTGYTYSFEAICYTISNIAGGVKFSIDGSATATYIVYEALFYQSGAVVAQLSGPTLGSAVGITAVTTALVRITGTITVNASGQINLFFAQNATDVNPSTLLRGSVFHVTRLN